LKAQMKANSHKAGIKMLKRALMMLMRGVLGCALMQMKENWQESIPVTDHEAIQRELEAKLRALGQCAGLGAFKQFLARMLKGEVYARVMIWKEGADAAIRATALARMKRDKGMNLMRQMFARLLKGQVWERLMLFRQNWKARMKQTRTEIWNEAMKAAFHIPMYAGVMWEYKRPNEDVWTPYNAVMNHKFEQCITDRVLQTEMDCTEKIGVGDYHTAMFDFLSRKHIFLDVGTPPPPDPVTNKATNWTRDRKFRGMNMPMRRRASTIRYDAVYHTSPLETAAWVMTKEYNPDELSTVVLDEQDNDTVYGPAEGLFYQVNPYENSWDTEGEPELSPKKAPKTPSGKKQASNKAKINMGIAKTPRRVDPPLADKVLREV